MAKQTALTEQAIRRAKLPSDPTKSGFVWDSRVPGFGVRLFASGRRVFVFQYRTREGKQRRLTGPLFDTVGLDEARTWGAAQRSAVWRGSDPGAGERRKKEAVATAEGASFQIEAVVADFVKRHLEGRDRAPRYVRDCESVLRRWVLTAWKGKDVRQITRRDVVALLDGIVDRGIPIAANRALAVVSKLFSWCVERGLLEHSPTARLGKPARERRRERVLTDAELAAVWVACDTVREPWGPYFRLLLLTGQRRSEVAGMRWEQVDHEAGTWTLPASATKMKRAHLVPLSGLAQGVLAGIGWQEQGFVFEPRYGALSGFSGGKNLLVRELPAGFAEFKIHDFRRTAASGLGRLGVQPHVIAAVLNHAPQGITAQVYNRYSYQAEKAEALERWAAHLAGLVEPPKAEAA
jgi:integrase